MWIVEGAVKKVLVSLQTRFVIELTWDLFKPKRMSKGVPANTFFYKCLIISSTDFDQSVGFEY